jgi:hypothetical protein
MRRKLQHLAIGLLSLCLMTWAGCGDLIEYPINPSPGYHHVSLMLGSRQVTLNYGRMDINPDTPTLAVSPSKDSMRIDGESARDPGDKHDIAVSFWSWLGAYTPGSYIGTYGCRSGTAGWCQISLDIKEKGDDYPYWAQSGSLTMDSFDSVGGAIDGEIDADFLAQAGPSPTFGSQFHATGRFRLLRVPDPFYSRF